jgi:hypothetical protein
MILDTYSHVAPRGSKALTSKMINWMVTILLSPLPATDCKSSQRVSKKKGKIDHRSPLAWAGSITIRNERFFGLIVSPKLRRPYKVQNHDEVATLVSACAAGDVKLLQRLLKVGRGTTTSIQQSQERNEASDEAVLAAAEFALSSEGTPRVKVKVVNRMLMLLYSHGITPTPDNLRLAKVLITSCNADGLAQSITYGLDLQKFASECVSAAAACADITILEVLRDNGISINTRNTWGNTVLHHLADGTLIFNDELAPKRKRDPAHGLTQKLSVLLGVGLDIDAVDAVGATALCRAIATDNLDFARSLLSQGANPTVKMRNGVDAVHLAAAKCPRDFIELILRCKNAQTSLSNLRLTRAQPDVISLIRALAKSSDGYAA